ncbi:MAG: PIN domain-containing protein [Candidatus Dormibacteraceae bacterium]
MRIYVDASALIKRSIRDAESAALSEALDRYVGEGSALVASTLAWVEVSRAIRSRPDAAGRDDGATREAIDVALSGVAGRPITGDVISLARHIGPTVLRSLDALHLATALLLGVDLIVTYDDRLISACRYNGFAVATPGR